MKTRFLILLLCCFGTLAAKAQAKLTLTTSVYDFDTIAQYSPGVALLTFTNTGDAPLILTSCQTATSADVCDWPKEPIQPGKTGTIRYRFDTHRCGPWNKTVTVTANDGNTALIRIKAVVQCKPE